MARVRIPAGMTAASLEASASAHARRLRLTRDADDLERVAVLVAGDGCTVLAATLRERAAAHRRDLRACA